MAITMASASHGSLSLLSTFVSCDGHAPRSPFFEGCRTEQQWMARNCGLSGKLPPISVGRQPHRGRTCISSSSFGWREDRGLSLDRKARRSQVVTSAIPPPLAAAATALAVGGAVFALIKLNENKLPILQDKQKCEVCEGSGICPTCNGEGFVNKAMSEEAAARARARAKDAATRYTAGLPRKWNYCSDCSGQRGCRSCSGRGWIA